MNDTIKEFFLSRTGQIVHLEYQKKLKTLKEHKDKTITKKVSLSAFAGKEYDNMRAVQEKREDGTLPEENQGLPYGEWEVYPYIIKHKDERHYRFARLKNKNNVPRVEYYVDGVLAEKEKVAPMCYGSEFPTEKADNDVFNVKENNIILIR